MAKPKILHISSERGWRGGEQQIAYLIEYSTSIGAEVVVVVRQGSDMEKWCQEERIKHVSASFRNGIDISTARAIRRTAKNENVDFVHAHSGKGHSLAFLALKLGMRKPLIVHRRVDFPLKKSGFSLKKYNHPNVKAIICVSDTIKNMVAPFIAEPDRATTVYSGIDFNRFNQDAPTGYLHQEFGIDPSKKLVANISALAPHKDYPTFLMAAKTYLQNRDDVHFLIVGGGSLEEQLKSDASQLGIDHQVTFTGFRNDIPSVFRELYAFLITSSTEGLGTTVIDALHNGLPVVATKGGGIPELVRDGVEGFLSEVGDEVSLAEQLERLTTDPELRDELGKNAMERSKMFSKEEMGKGVHAVYKRLMS